jgi:hypothetical protein
LPNGKYEEPEQLERQSKTIVNDGDIFSLLVLEYELEFEIQRPNMQQKDEDIQTIQKRKLQTQNNQANNNNSPHSTPKKQKMIFDDDADNPSHYDAVDLDDEDEKPPCPYGTGCYRKNPDHHREFSHNFTLKKQAPNKIQSSPQKQGSTTTNSNGAKTLAFPSISTSTYAFDVDQAAKSACKVISNFLAKYDDPDIKLVLVDTSNSSALQAFKKVT